MLERYDLSYRVFIVLPIIFACQSGLSGFLCPRCVVLLQSRQPLFVVKPFSVQYLNASLDQSLVADRGVDIICILYFCHGESLSWRVGHHGALLMSWLHRKRLILLMASFFQMSQRHLSNQASPSDQAPYHHQSQEENKTTSKTRVANIFQRTCWLLFNTITTI